MITSTSIGHQIGGRNNDELVDSMIKTNLIEKRSRVEEAFRRVDRAKFIPASLQPQAYENRPLKIGILATISTPQQHAQVITFLEPHLQEGMRALDIGCGSGFLVAVMAQLVGISGYIKGIDIVPELVHFSQENLKKSLENELISRIYIKKQKQGKFFEIQQEGEELYDCIHVGVAVETKAEAERFATMLKPGGGLLIPLGVAGQEQKLIKVNK
jgi:protein-L-isoaspartate(D-aspartate) O-methyltransferase